MTERNPPVFMDATVSPAEYARRMLQSIMGPGVARGPLTSTTVGDLAVTEHAGTPGMSVDVAAGGVYVLGSSTTYQGTYFVENNAALQLTISAADGSNPRKDIVTARVRENAYDAGGVNAWDLRVITGTPAASPTAPATPANHYLLATVDVPAADTAITNSQITDARTLARPWNSAWGEITRATVTAAQNFTTLADLTNLTTTWTGVAGRKYKLTMHCRAWSSAALDTMQFQITGPSSNTVISEGGHVSNTNTGAASTMVMGFVTGTGSLTYKGRAQRATGGTGTCALQAGATAPAFLVVEDIGPS